MSMIELFWVTICVTCGIVLGRHLWMSYGILGGILGFVVGFGFPIAMCYVVSLIPFIGDIGKAKPAKPPCHVCNEYKWIGADGEANLIAECKCGKHFRWKEKKWQEICDGPVDSGQHWVTG